MLMEAEIIDVVYMHKNLWSLQFHSLSFLLSCTPDCACIRSHCSQEEENRLEEVYTCTKAAYCVLSVVKAILTPPKQRCTMVATIEATEAAARIKS